MMSKMWSMVVKRDGFHETGLVNQKHGVRLGKRCIDARRAGGWAGDDETLHAKRRA
jgi:hypothetical protein